MLMYGWKERAAIFEASKSMAVDSEDKMVAGKPNFQLPITTTLEDYLEGMKKAADEVAKMLGKPWTF